MKNLLSKKVSQDDSSRERLLSGAAKLFANKGFDRVSVREIAKESGCNICLVSYYFGGKEKLYQSIFEAFFERISKHIDRTEQTLGDSSRSLSREEFRDELRKHIRFVITEFQFDPAVKVMLHREVMDGFPRTKKIFDNHLRRLRTGMTVLFERGQQAGHIKAKIHVPTFAILLNRGIEAYLVSHTFAKPIREIGIDPIQETKRFVEQLEEIFLKGVLT